MSITDQELSRITGISNESIESARNNVQVIAGSDAFGRASHTYFDHAQFHARKVIKELSPFGALGAGGLHGYVSGKKDSNDAYKQGKAKAAENLNHVLKTLQQFEKNQLCAATIELFIKDLHEIRRELLVLTLAQREWFHTTSKGGTIAQIFDGKKYKVFMQRLAEMYVLLKEKELKDGLDVSPEAALGMYERAKQRTLLIGKPLPSYAYVAKVLDPDDWLVKARIKTNARRLVEQKAAVKAPVAASEDNIDGLALRRAESELTVRVSPDMTAGLAAQEAKHREERELKAGYPEKPQPLQIQMAGAVDNEEAARNRRYEKSGKGLARLIEVQKKVEEKGVSLEKLLVEEKFEKMLDKHRAMSGARVVAAFAANKERGPIKLTPLAEAKVEEVTIKTFAATNSSTSSRLFSQTPTQTASSSPSPSQLSSAGSSGGGCPDKKHSPGSSPTPMSS